MIKRTKLESITLVFENCEEETIPAENFDSFSIGNITKKLSLNACNELEEFVKATDIVMRIPSKGNVLHKGLTEDGNMLLFDRIQRWSDITQIELCFEQGTDSQLYFVGYSEDDFCRNKYQSNWIDGLGNLWVVITNDESLLNECEEYSDQYYSAEKSTGDENEKLD